MFELTVITELFRASQTIQASPSKRSRLSGSSGSSSIDTRQIVSLCCKKLAGCTITPKESQQLLARSLPTNTLMACAPELEHSAVDSDSAVLKRKSNVSLLVERTAGEDTEIAKQAAEDLWSLMLRWVYCG